MPRNRKKQETPVVFTPELQGLLSQISQEELETGVLKRAVTPDQGKDWALADIEKTVRLGQALQTTSNTELCRGHFSVDDSAEA